MRGYFGIGVEGISKPMNLGALFRSAHAFGASFVFTVAADYLKARSDTTDMQGSVPYYDFADIGALRLPKDCALVGVEFRDDAVELPSFRHPRCAAYVLGPDLRAGCRPQVVVPTSWWQTAVSLGAWTLVGCTVAPGFRFEGFEMASPDWTPSRA